jgi:RNA-directed DNA polymerase
MAGTSKPGTVCTRQQRIAELAKQSPEMGFTSLNHHLDLAWLFEAFHRTRKDAATGVDGQTADDYLKDLPDNLQSLVDRAKSGTYRAPPVRRTYILKGTGPETRPLGIPTFEDKVLQRAVVMLLEPIYEQDFKNCSYGYRQGRSAHQALEAVWQQTMGTQGGWIVEVDIRKFFDTLDHAHLRELLKRRVRDGVILRLIGKWLNAGVLEQGSLSFPESGTPQGGVITPPTMWQTVRSPLKGLFLVVGCAPATARDGSLNKALEGQGLRWNPDSEVHHGRDQSPQSAQSARGAEL